MTKPSLKKEKRRIFGGKLFVPPDGKDGKTRSEANKWVSNFNKAHLKAYLRGDKLFMFGRDKHHQPLWYPVIESWV